jgi:hypothetical protein
VSTWNTNASIALKREFDCETFPVHSI